MICILHGYLLEGSGSNLWTRSIIQSLCRAGKTVHLLCQENHPEIYDFISKVNIYMADGKKETFIDREVPYEGKCIMHKPFIGKTLPVYVWDKYEEFSDVVPMVNLDDYAINNYLNRNVEILKQVVLEYNVNVIHANHAVLMSVVAQRVSEELSIPFAIMPHGSAIEYAVKKDQRFFDFALDAFRAANRIYVIGKELRNRVKTLFPQIDNLENKISDLHLGADTSLFQPITRKQRKEYIQKLCTSITTIQRGKTSDMSTKLQVGLNAQITQSQLIEVIRKNCNYNPKQTDYDLESRLSSVNWEEDKILLFVGRIIASKGIHSIIAALPFIMEKHPNTKLIIIGHGPLREPLETLIWALRNGAVDLVNHLIDWGTKLEGSGSESLKEYEQYLSKLKNDGMLDRYFDSAQKYITEQNVIFTGYLTHKELQYLFPASDSAVFPSVVAEAGPLVFLEAMASGCFPIGTYFAGMAASIDSVADAVPDDVLDIMKLSANESETVSDIVLRVNESFNVDDKHKIALRNIAVEKYDWQNIGKRLSNDLDNLNNK